MIFSPRRKPIRRESEPVDCIRLARKICVLTLVIKNGSGFFKHRQLAEDPG